MIENNNANMAERKKREPPPMRRKGRVFMPSDIFDLVERNIKNLRKYFDYMWMPSVREPCCDIIEKEKEIVVTAEIPGISKENIDLTVMDDAIEIRGKMEKEKEDKEREYIRKERIFSSYYRHIDLPVEINPDKAMATLNNGVLEIILPKKKPRKGKKLKID
ncbi:MAG: Hsp20/alpha crystallin family protein [Thermoplasmata archaeon]|nr:MAG: Hsp20/alpha crystallin family protein [Thermoplasmata archaeon]